MKFLDKICFLLFLTNVDSRLKDQHRPCSFNPLCTCSNGGPDLGSVCCHNIPFMTIPAQINSSAIYIMSLKDNKLRFLENNSLNGTGLWKLQINNNLITDLPSDALAGLEKTLTILDLSKNALVRIPKEAIQNLEKLSNLNLAGNEINFLHNEDFRNIGRTLKHLDLSNNALMHIQSDAFRNMISLEVLNLGYNSITSIDDITFQGGLNNLKHIILTGNQIQQIPLNALANLKNIKIVNLNKNFISTISEGREIRNRIYLDELHLEYNLIGELTAESFRLFHQVNRIFLKGNPITTVNDTFLTANATEIHLSHCLISVVTKNAFISVTHSLQVLDLGYNNLKEFPTLPLTRLTKLTLAGNAIKEITPDDFNYYGTSLKYLDIAGSNMNGLSQESMKNLPNLREFFFNKKQSAINSEYLKSIGPSMEKLSIVKCSVKIIENGAFYKLSSLKVLDLSYNLIARIENTTFKDIRHSLERLILHNSLKLPVFPFKALHYLSKLEYLDASSNAFTSLPQEALSTFHNLKYLNLNYNELKDLDLNFVNDLQNPNLEHLKIAFNKIRILKSHAFRNLQNLVYLQLNDNLIEHIRRSAFLDLDSLMVIRLEGNAIKSIDNEAFQNLPNIQHISLAYNKLSSLNLEAFNQVGRLSTLKIDVDHNNIQNLTGNYSESPISSNIKFINFSHNNISYIDSNYFDPIRLSVTILDLSHNEISNLTNFAFASMAQLQILTLTSNKIQTIDENDLRGLKAMQILDISKNNINQIEENVFEEQKKLRILSVACNEMEELFSGTFSSTILEQLDLSFNNFDEFPEDAILKIKDTLQFLDLTGNNIQSINFTNIATLKNLRYFSISQNELFLPDSSEFHLSKLISLDFSHNPITKLPIWIANHLPRSLETLNLANTSLKYFPILKACNILHLNLSSNAIQTVEAEAIEELKQIKILDISNNLLLTTYNNIWSNLQQLKALYLQRNPIQKLLNNSFSNMERLQELFIKNLNLQEIHQDTFYQLPGLKKIEMDTYPDHDINLSQMLSKNQGIEEIHLHVQENVMDGKFGGYLPKSLKVLVLEGGKLKHVDESAFSYIQSETFQLDIRNSNITQLSEKVFDNLKVKNFTASFVNNKLQKIAELYTKEKREQGNNLKRLQLMGNQLHCDCKLAWIREWMQEYEYENKCDEKICEEDYLHDMREARCTNMKNTSIINVFKTELDCFSSGTQGSIIGIFFYIFNTAVILIYIKEVVI